MTNTAHIQAFFDEATFTVTYLVGDPATKQAVVIDSVLDFDPASGKVSTGSAEAVLAAAEQGGWTITHVLETHAHADHLSAAPLIKGRTGARVGIGAHIDAVQQVFAGVFNAPDVSGTGAEFDDLFADGETFAVGELVFEVLHTPGHTAACIAYKVGDAIFVGDTLFMPDYGTARTDFPGGNAAELYQSIRRMLAYPPETRLFMCHDYKALGRDEYVWETTVAEQRAKNIHIHDGVTEAEFVAMRLGRDAGLAAPRLLLPSVQVNIRAGHLPPAEDNAVHYLKLPLRLPDGFDLA
ncbi:MAG: MBL fold metallo-hydrolase [Novosphingobium sp.]|jgi:glyoxylase-like metal-dependent hydrolase (beta-lactamase superfamily II)|nr:MBL fold metallo-hydrolase [Novosphingobium sp.]